MEHAEAREELDEKRLGVSRIKTGQVAAGLVTLIAGGLVYVLHRSRSLLLFHVADRLGMGTGIDSLRSQTTGQHLPEIVVYSLPGGLWAAAYVLIVDGVLNGQPRKRRLLWTSVIPAVGIVSELMQYAGLLPGTADAADIVCYGLPYLVYIIYNTYVKK